MSVTRAVYKLNLGDENLVRFRASKDAKMLAVQLQHGHPTIWYETDIDPKSFVDWSVVLVATGEPFLRPAPFYDDFVYYGTLQVNDGQLVWHYYGDMPRV